MKFNCKDIQIDWMEGYGNHPYINIVGAELPPCADKSAAVWERRRCGKTYVHVAVDGDFVSFFSTDGRPTTGFGGATFEGTFKDGTKYRYEGAWSSRAGVVNKVFPELQVVDVAFQPQHLASHIRAAAMIEWRFENPRPWGLVWVEEGNGERILMPTRRGVLKNKLRNDERIVECAVAEV